MNIFSQFSITLCLIMWFKILHRFFNIPKVHSFHVLPDTLKVRLKVTLDCRCVHFCVRANRCWPTRITIVAYQIHTSFKSTAPLFVVVLPSWVLENSICSYAFYVGIRLHNVLIVPISKLRSINNRHHIILRLYSVMHWNARVGYPSLPVARF